MPTSRTRIIFSDVDGTLLDAHYEHPFSAEFLRHAFGRERIVLVSSRTLAELVQLARELHGAPDLIGEDGAFIATHDERLAQGLEQQGSVVTPVSGLRVAALAAPRSVTRAKVREAVRNSGGHTIVADELPPDRFAELSGYDATWARHAVKRRFSVLLKDPDAGVTQSLRDLGLEANAGGRWVSVVGGSSKGRAVRAYRAAAERIIGPVLSVGIGDAENDETLLRSVDRAFVIWGLATGHPPELAAIPGAHLLSRPGPAGWQEMLEILEREDDQ